MAKQLINTGNTANDNTGDSLRQGAIKINNNLNEIYGTLGNGTTLLSRDINLSNYKILFSNKVATREELNTLNAFNYVGCVIYVESEDSLYFSANGVWRRLLIDTSDSVSNNYSDPLNRAAYTGNLTDLGIDDGTANQVLVSNGNRTFQFRTLESIISNFDGDYNSLTNRPNLATVATSGSYNDLNNRPTLPTDLGQLTDLSNLLFSGSYNDLTDKPAIPTDISQLSDNSNALFSGDYTDLTNRPTLATVSSSGSYNDLTDRPVLFSGSYNDLSNKPTLSVVAGSGSYTDLLNLPTLFSGSYNDLDDKPTTFSGLVSLQFLSGVAINEFSSDGTLSGNSNSAVPTENAVKTYVDAELSGISITQSLNDLSDVNTGGVTDGQILVYNSGNWSPGNIDSIGNFVLSSSNIDTDDSSAITITPAVLINSDLTVENDLTVNNLLTVNKLSVSAEIESSGTGTPELFSEADLLITAGTSNRVSITQSPLKFASFTTSQRNAITAENGDVIYNITTNKFQGYANSVWVDLH